MSSSASRAISFWKFDVNNTMYHFGRGDQFGNKVAAEAGGFTKIKCAKGPVEKDDCGKMKLITCSWRTKATNWAASQDKSKAICATPRDALLLGGRLPKAFSFSDAPFSREELATAADAECDNFQKNSPELLAPCKAALRLKLKLPAK